MKVITDGRQVPSPNGTQVTSEPVTSVVQMPMILLDDLAEVHPIVDGDLSGGPVSNCFGTCKSV